MESCKELRENNPYLFNSWRAILYTMNILDSSEWVNKEDYYGI